MNDTSICWVLTSLTAFSAMTMQDIAGLVVTILTGAASLAYICFKWYKEAKKDGNITKDEVDKLIDDVYDEIKNTTDKIDKLDKKD